MNRVYYNRRPVLSWSPEMGQGTQDWLNKLVGASPGEPIKIPIELPEIMISKETMNDFQNTMILSTGIIAGGIIIGQLVRSLTK